VKSITEKFKEIENNEIGTTKLKFKPKLNIIGLKCILNLNHKNLSANYTAFYQKPKLKWELSNS
ncbi:MAG: hypothetical protein ACPG49_12690, partial [Chitinophagales bacterium]